MPSPDRTITASGSINGSIWTGGASMRKTAVLATLFLSAVPVGASAFDRFVNPNDMCPPAQFGGAPEHNTMRGDPLEPATNGSKVSHALAGEGGTDNGGQADGR
jgi:hypothetical protein